MLGPNKTIETFADPTSRGASPTQTSPSENLAEAFGMMNGKPITDPTSGFDPTNPFVNRDPRFGWTFVYNGTLMHLKGSATNQPVSIYFNVDSSQWLTKQTVTITAQADATLTWLPGYYWRKMLSVNTSSNDGPNTDRCLPLIRYAEILLNYAEAENEVGNTSVAYDQLKTIRDRAGILPGSDGMYGLPSGMTQDSMRSVIMNEREVELAWEDHRYWDVRRWKTAPINQNVDMKCMQILKNINTGSITYHVIPINVNIHHQFKDAYYLLPIMQSEISKNPNLIQNPGY
jgi:hypothetical protein